MNTRLRAAVLRAGAATALAIGLVVVAGPAYAADGPDVAVTPISLNIANGVKKAKAKPMQVELRNLNKTAAAADVTVQVDLSGLDDTLVGWIRPDGCDKAGKAKYTCVIGDIAADQDVVIGIPLFTANGKPGYAGSFKVSATVPGDTNTANNSQDVDVTVTTKSYDLTTWAQDVYAEVVADGDEVGEETTKTPVPPGGTAPLDSAIFNDGSRKVVGVGYSVKLPAGSTFAEIPEGCFTDDNEENMIFCEDDEIVLKPGAVLLPKVTVKVLDGTAAGVLKDGIVDAYSLEEKYPGDDEAEMATQTQRKTIVDADPIDNSARFDVFVGAAPTTEPTTPPGEGGPGTGEEPGSGGGLPVTGAQTGLIAGVGAAVLVVGVVLFVGMRRRRRFTAE